PAPAAPCRAGRRREVGSRLCCAPAATAATSAPAARAPRLRCARLHGGICVVVGVRCCALSLHDGRLKVTGVRPLAQVGPYHRNVAARGLTPTPVSARRGAGGWPPGRRA